MKVKEAIEHLNNYNPEEEICLIIWTGDDVRTIANQNKKRLSNKRINEIVSELERRHDASIGVNWDTIEFLVEWK